jgi:hypothetical protein
MSENLVSGFSVQVSGIKGVKFSCKPSLSFLLRSDESLRKPGAVLTPDTRHLKPICDIICSILRKIWITQLR